MSYQYDNEFFDFVNASAGKSASGFIAAMLDRGMLAEPVRSVLDVGCGRGVWTAEWARRGVGDVTGVDGDYVTRESLLIAGDRFVAADISKPFRLQRRFDFVQCLEVAEHVPGVAADTLIANLTSHGDLVLFSAAVPGQGGEFHVNEQPFTYWRQRFATHGYRMYDAVRPLVKDMEDVEPWYRYNAFVYATGDGAARLSKTARDSLVPESGGIANVAPWSWRMRCAAVSMMPTNLATTMARMKHRLANRVGV